MPRIKGQYKAGAEETARLAELAKIASRDRALCACMGVKKFVGPLILQVGRWK